MPVLFAAFAVLRWYVYTGKKVEVMKGFSDEEDVAMKNGDTFSFFAPYVLWVSCT